MHSGNSWRTSNPHQSRFPRLAWVHPAVHFRIPPGWHSSDREEQKELKNEGVSKSETWKTTCTKAQSWLLFSAMSHDEDKPEQLLNQQREAVTQITSRLFAHVSHDLGTPASALRGYLKMVLDDRVGPLTDIQREYLTIAMDNAERICGLATRMTKVPDFIDRLRAEVFDIRGEWEETVSARRAALQEKAIKVTERSSPGQMFVAGDRKQLRQVFERMMDVSIESSQHGNEVLAEFSRGRDRDITVRIWQSGDGMPTATDLSVIHHIIFLHGGTLSLEAQSEAGSTCIINLPGAG